MPTREPTADLHPRTMRGVGGRPGEIDRMLRGHPGIASGVSDLRYGVASTQVEWRAPDDASPMERLFAETCASILHEHVTVDAHRPELTGWQAVGESLADHWVYGHTLHAMRLAECEGARHPMSTLDGLTVEAFPVHPSTVQRWHSTRDGRRLESVTQQTTGGPAHLPADALVLTQHGGAIGEYEGVSVLRPLVFLFERWVSLWTSAERNAYFAGGVMMTFAPPGETEDDRARVEDAQIGWMNGFQPILNLPAGYTKDSVVIGYPSGTGPDVRGQAEYIDGQIAQALNRALTSLGYTAHGSRALGEAMAEADAWTDRAQLDILLGRWSIGAARWLAEQVGYRGRMPRLVIVDEEAPNMQQRGGVLGQVVRDGLLRWTGADEAELREQLGLGERAPEQVESAALNGAQAQAMLQAGQLVQAGEISLDWALGTLRGIGVTDDQLRQIQGLPPLPKESAASLSERACCDHGVVTLAEPVTVRDGEGMPYVTHRPLTELESHVRFARIDREMGEMGDQMTARIEAIAVEHRAATWAALASGYDPAALASTYDFFRARYREVVEGYAQGVGDMVADEAARELRSQERDGLPAATPSSQTPGEGTPALQRLPARVDIVAEAMASRVQGEVEQAWTDGQSPAAWASRITADGLTRDARSVGERILAEGRVAVGDQLAPGVRVVEVVRSGIRDTRQCSVCRAADGTAFRLPEQLAEYDAMVLPDPDCEGGSSRCRCGWLVRWGRVTDV